MFLFLISIFAFLTNDVAVLMWQQNLHGSIRMLSWKNHLCSVSNCRVLQYFYVKGICLMVSSAARFLPRCFMVLLFHIVLLQQWVCVSHFWANYGETHFSLCLWIAFLFIFFNADSTPSPLGKRRYCSRRTGSRQSRLITQSQLELQPPTNYSMQHSLSGQTRKQGFTFQHYVIFFVLCPW